VSLGSTGPEEVADFDLGHARRRDVRIAGPGMEKYQSYSSFRAARSRPVHVLDDRGPISNYATDVPGALTLNLERTEALELLAVVQATLNAIARSQQRTVGAAILTGIKTNLIDALEAG